MLTTRADVLDDTINKAAKAKAHTEFDDQKYLSLAQTLFTPQKHTPIYILHQLTEKKDCNSKRYFKANFLRASCSTLFPSLFISISVVALTYSRSIVYTVTCLSFFPVRARAAEKKIKKTKITEKLQEIISQKKAGTELIRRETQDVKRILLKSSHSTLGDHLERYQLLPQEDQLIIRKVQLQLFFFKTKILDKKKQ